MPALGRPAACRRGIPLGAKSARVRRKFGDDLASNLAPPGGENVAVTTRSDAFGGAESQPGIMGLAASRHLVEVLADQVNIWGMGLTPAASLGVVHK